MHGMSPPRESHSPSLPPHLLYAPLSQDHASVGVMHMLGPDLLKLMPSAYTVAQELERYKMGVLKVSDRSGTHSRGLVPSCRARVSSRVFHNLYAPRLSPTHAMAVCSRQIVNSATKPGAFVAILEVRSKASVTPIYVAPAPQVPQALKSTA